MCKCNYPGCNESFANHSELAKHIFRDHAARMLVAIIAALAIALMLLHPVSAQDAPQPTPTVGGGPQIAVEHKVFLPFVANGNDVKAAVSWCPSCSPRR